MSKFYIKKQYKTTNSVIVPDFVDAEQTFHLASAPESDMGWIIIAPWTTNEETCFFHKAVGNTVYVHWVNRSNPNIHAIGTIVYYASTIDYLNYLLSRQNHQMYIYKTSDDNVVVLGWEFYVGGTYTTVPDMDTSLGLPNQTLLVNSTSWIHLVNGVYTILPARNNAHYYVGNVITDIAGVITEINLANVTHLSTKGDKWDKWDKGDKGDQWDVGITYRGAYNNGTTYVPRDVVLYEGQLYINILAGTGFNPSDALHWNLFLPKSDLALGLKQDSFVDVTSSVFTLTSTPFDSSVVYVFIRQRKGIVDVDYTYSSITNQVTLLPPAITSGPQTIEILYATSGVGGSVVSDHLVLSDVTDTVPGTLFDKMLGQWDLTVETLEPSPGDVKILISAPERTYTSVDNTVAITLTEFTDVQWLIHKNVDLSAPGSGGGWATSTTVNSLNFAFTDELNITSTDTSVGVATTQNVDGDINIDLSVVIPDTTINGLTFDLTDSLNVTSTDSSVTITPTQNPAGDITLDLSATPSGWATSTTVNGLTFDLADTLTIASNDSSATISTSQDVSGNVVVDISVPDTNNTYTTYVSWEAITAGKPVFIWVDGKAYHSGTHYVWIATSSVAVDTNIKVWHIGTYNLSWFNLWDSIYLGMANTWSARTSMITSRWAFWVGVVNNKIYCIGWFNGAYSWVNEEYDPVLNTWTTKANMLTARHSLTASVVNNKIYCIGWSNSSYVGNNEEYNPLTNVWAVKTIMPTARNSAAAAVYNGYIYVIGWTNWSTLNVNQRFDPINNVWITLAPMTTARFGLTASTVGDKIYCIGWANGWVVNTNQEYNIVADTWSNKLSMPTSRYAFCSAVVEDEIYCIGWDNGSVVGNNEKYNPVSNTWTSLTWMITPRSELWAWVVSNRIYTIGWTITWTLGTINSINEVYDLSPAYTNTWVDALGKMITSAKALFFKI